jgi:hypothetical protein
VEGQSRQVTEGQLIENRTLRGQTDQRIKAIEKVIGSSDRKQNQV